MSEDLNLNTEEPKPEKNDEMERIGDKSSDIDNDSMDHLKIQNPDPKDLEKQTNCYCGKDRNLNITELLCAKCNKWFHESCISYELGKLVPFMSNYIFVCKNCSLTGLETFKKNQARMYIICCSDRDLLNFIVIKQMCVTAIANLQRESYKEGINRTMFSEDKEIIPYIENHWEALTASPRKVTKSWYFTVFKTLVKGIHILFVGERSASDGQMYGLLCTDLTQIRPKYKGMIRSRVLRITDTGIQHAPAASRVKGKNKKRKFQKDSGASGAKGSQVDIGALKLSVHGYPLDHPFNRDGYRYFLAEPDPYAPCRQEFDDRNDWAGKPIPGWLYRIVVPSTVLLSLHDRAPQLKISEDRLAVTGEKGYSMVRATHWVNRDCWYWEATVQVMPEVSAVRIGWGQDYANLQAPLGFDKFGYSWRSKQGTRFHESIGKYYSSGYGKGDTLGCLIFLPETSSTELIPDTYKDKPLIKFKSHLYYEDKDNVAESLKNLKLLEGSKIVFFKNGICQGVAFTDIYAGRYYPAISIYKGATVVVNFGPNFKHFPSVPDIERIRGMNKRAEEAVYEHACGDTIYLLENEGNLILDSSDMSQ
ncbi:hypothetical protein FQR65_LT19730 [Abscondita terminalis]|nr:hypothetical protein FQR65_LT19730 [Abscondita terminalis]